MHGSMGLLLAAATLDAQAGNGRLRRRLRSEQGWPHPSQGRGTSLHKSGTAGGHRR